MSPRSPVGLLSEDLVATRLRAVSDEIAHLDRDRSRFALAFRTRVAWDAYRALQDDALQLAQGRSRAFDVGAGVEVDVSVPTGRGSREELEQRPPRPAAPPTWRDRSARRRRRYAGR